MNGCFWEFFILCSFERFPTWPNNIINYLGSSHRRWSIRKGIIRNFGKFTGKILRQSLFFNKVAGCKKKTLARCLPVNFAKFIRTPFLKSTSWRLVLKKTHSPKTKQKTIVKLSYNLWIHFFDSNSPQAPSNLISFTFLLILRPFTLFKPKIRAIKWQKDPKICFT